MPAADLLCRLSAICGVGPWIATLAGAPAVETHTREATAWHAAREQMPQSQWIDLALARWSIGNAERIAGTVIDVLGVEEDDDPLRRRAVQARRTKRA